MPFRRLLTAALLTLALSACGTPVGLRTAPAVVEGCETALLAGELVASARSGLAIQTGDGVTEVLWPFGYTAARETSGLVLRDPTGTIVGHEGQRVRMAGGLSADNTWNACAGTIEEASSEGG